jgi:mannose/fructose/N-acetylgalactosamine-specific phosphotransferase system component IIC
MALGWQLLTAFIWGGLMALERKAFLQAMFSRPMVAATVMGLLLGDATSGLFIGMLLELFHLGTANLGAALPEHETLVATGTAAAAGAMARALGTPSTPAVWALCVLMFLWLGHAGRLLDHALEGFATRTAQRALARATRGELTSAMRQNLLGMWPNFVCFGAVTALCVLGGHALSPALAKLPIPALRGLAWAYPAMTAVAAGMAVRGSRAKRAAFFGGVCAAFVALVAALVSIVGARA